MAERQPPRTPPSATDGEGVRVVAKPRGPRRTWALLAVIALVAAAVWWWLLPQGQDAMAAAADKPALATTDAAPQSAHPTTPTPVQELPAMPSNDPNDLASHFRPGDPEPTGAEVIEALHEAGIRTGLGAFNPPGTSPPLEGLAVPDDYDLPPGYVRHHQVTDEGVAIEPILMFSPDFNLRDAQGRPIPLPADRIVTAQFAPPGLPLRRIRIPSP